MLIIPFIHKITDETIYVHNIRILTIGGTNLWEEPDSTSINEILSSNGIYSKNIKKIDNIYLCEVDTEKTDINDIYKWNEIDINDDTFCWRDYVHFIGKNKECWLHLPKDEKIGNIHIHTLFERIGI